MVIRSGARGVVTEAGSWQPIRFRDLVRCPVWFVQGLWQPALRDARHWKSVVWPVVSAYLLVQQLLYSTINNDTSGLKNETVIVGEWECITMNFLEYGEFTKFQNFNRHV